MRGMSRCNVKIRRFAALAGAGATGATLAAIALADPVAHDSSNGVGRESAASIDIAYALAAQPDGKIVAAGLSATSGRNEVALDRYAPDGTLDRSFGTGGRLVTDFRSPNSLATALATQADAKVVVAGYADISASLHGRYEFALARYTRQGTLDLSFGRNGRVLTHFGGRRSSSGVNAVAIQSDGNLVAAGFGSGFALARYTARGTLDRSFGRSGKVVVG